MADSNSSQKWLGRNRPPRVQITYDVEIGGAFEKKELPLVVGILASLGGDTDLSPTPLDARSFVNIDADTFDTILGKIKPTLAYAVAKVGSDDANEKLPVELTFEKFEHFDPRSIVERLDGLKELFAKRQKLQDLLIKLDGNAKLDKDLAAGLADSDQLKQLTEDLDAALKAAGDGKAGKLPADADPA